MMKSNILLALVFSACSAAPSNDSACETTVSRLGNCAGLPPAQITFGIAECNRIAVQREIATTCAACTQGKTCVEIASSCRSACGGSANDAAVD